MGRYKRIEDKKAERYRPNPFAIVPIDKEALKMRLERHSNLMGELLSEGKDFNSLPINVLKTIVRDFQIAGLEIPTPALQRVKEHQQAGLKNRPAPIFLPSVTDTSREKDLRSDLITRGYNPKTGTSNGPSPLPYSKVGPSRAGSVLPYVPVHRYGKNNLFSESANKTASAWLPPWMIYGDQPNQFVKTPHAQSMGRGPSLEYVNSGAYYPQRKTSALSRALLAGAQPSVAAEPLTAMYDRPVTSEDVLTATGKIPAREKANLVEESKKVKAVEEQRGDLIDLSKPVRVPARGRPKLSEQSKKVKASEEDRGTRPRGRPKLSEQSKKVQAVEENRGDLIDLSKPVRIPARGRPKLSEQSKKVKATEEEIRNLIDLEKPVRIPARGRPKLSEQSKKVKATEEEIRNLIDLDKPVHVPAPRRRYSDLVKAVAAAESTPVAAKGKSAKKKVKFPALRGSRAVNLARVVTPDVGSNVALEERLGIPRRMQEPMRGKADLSEGSKKATAKEEYRPRKRAHLTEESKKVSAVEELAPAAALLAELPMIDEFEGSPVKKSRRQQGARIAAPRLARKKGAAVAKKAAAGIKKNVGKKAAAKAKAKASPKKPWIPAAVYSPSKK
jgi:hypothetical protein